MNTSIVPHTPAEALQISPEALIVASTYLEFQDIHKTADKLNIPLESVTRYLARREVKSFIDSVFLNTGYNNSLKMRSLMDAVINKKLEEMQEAEIGSSKDITEILALSHKMTMDLLDKQIKLEQIKQTNIKNQTNVQINDSGGNNYQALLDKLINKPK